MKTTRATLAHLRRESMSSFVSLSMAVICMVLSVIPIVNAQSSQLLIKPTHSFSIAAVLSSGTHEATQTKQNKPAPTVQACTPIGSTDVNPVDLSLSPTGLTTENDLPVYYTIFGRDAPTLNSQIRHCGPRGDGTASAFAAMTTYSLTWQYQTQELGDGNCSLSDVKVGLHLSSTLPEWQSDAYAKNGLTGRWQRFMTALEQHEKGHAELDKKYAEQIAQDLQTIPASSCETLSRTADALIRVDTGALDVANHTYDRETQHGATQGAVIPTY